MSEKHENSIYSRISEARKHNDTFNQFVDLCEKEIACWIDNMKAKNDVPLMHPKAPRNSESTTISILLPIVPISPNETELLLEYLKAKYISSGTRTVGGNYFRLKKCLFKKNYKLSSHSYQYDFF